MTELAEDEKALREWMQANVGGLRDDRSTASYALEFLKTAKANAEFGHASWAADGLATRIDEIGSKLTKAMKQLEGTLAKLPSQGKAVE